MKLAVLLFSLIMLVAMISGCIQKAPPEQPEEMPAEEIPEAEVPAAEEIEEPTFTEEEEVDLGSLL
jgi:Na+-transporting methylmalonyl-CoA/oxaloacetate decarboxylase gamma subunit